MQVRMALSPNSLARRKPGVQIPSPPPPTLQVRASSASSGRRSPHSGAALGPRPPMGGSSTSAWEGCRRWSTIRATFAGPNDLHAWRLKVPLGVQLQSPVGALAERLAQLLAGDEPKLRGGRVA